MASVNELDKVLTKYGVIAKVRELQTIPARGFPPGGRCWRVTLERPVKGEEKPMRLSLAFFAPADAEKPTAIHVVEAILSDVAAGEVTLWDFAQANGLDAKTDYAEHVYTSCKRIAARAKRFFGDGWEKVVSANKSASAAA